MTLPKIDKRVSFITGTIDLDNLHDLRQNLFGTYCISEVMFDLFMECDDYIWQSFGNNEYNDALACIELPSYVKDVNHYREELQHNITSAHGAAYRDSVEMHYYDAIKSHMEDIIETMQRKGFNACLVNKKGEPCEFYEAGEIFYSMTKKAYLDNFEDEYNYGAEFWAHHHADAEVNDFVNDLDVLKWEHIDYHGCAGSTDDWKARFEDYNEAFVTMKQDYEARQVTLKTLIKNKVGILKRAEILATQYPQIKA